MSGRGPAAAAARGRQGVYAGDVWLVPDLRLTFADYDERRRTRHERRYVLVAQGDDEGENRFCPSILVFPLSSRVDTKRSWEDVLKEHETPLTRPSIVKLHLLQPIPRNALLRDGRHVGAVPDQTFERLIVHFLYNLGIV